MKNRTLQTRYWCGDVVYLRVNEERKPGMVTQICINANGSVKYGVTWRGGAETWNFDCELTTEFVPDYGVIDSSKEAAS